jgi:hypothetical protein
MAFPLFGQILFVIFCNYFFGTSKNAVYAVSSCMFTSWIASPISHIWTSMPAALMPVLVASLTAARRGSNLGSKATVHAQSIMRPTGRESGWGWRVRHGDDRGRGWVWGWGG